MSRVHDALRRAEQAGAVPPVNHPVAAVNGNGVAAPVMDPGPNLAGLLEQVREVPFRAATDSLLIDVSRPHEAPMEEFRTLRTRLNHLKTLQPIHSVVVTSASPAEGKSLSAANLALAQAHLAGNTTLLADFDFRRPIVHTLFGLDRSPGITDFLLGKIPLHQAMRKVAGTNLYIMPAGEAVINPLELLNLREVKLLLERLPACSTGSSWIVPRCCSRRMRAC
jgi:protein-tyrosine kinase